VDSHDFGTPAGALGRAAPDAGIGIDAPQQHVPEMLGRPAERAAGRPRRRTRTIP
jgi:hypothetical protein